jgi:hypothetical protein
VEEVHRLGVTAVLAADAQLEAGAGGAALLGGDPDQPAHPVPVDRLERRDAEDAQLQVAPEERALDVELQILHEIYERARQIARDSNRSIESVLLDGLSLLFGALPDAGISPDELKDYSDEQLWAVVHQRLAWTQDTRLRELIALGKQGQITDEEKVEMERLIDLVDHQMLLRSEALLLLKQRGHNIEKQLKLGA